MCQHAVLCYNEHRKDFVNFCKFTKSQKRNNLLFLTPLYNTVTATLLILLLIPLTLFVGVYYFAGRKYYFISLLILLECMLPFFLIFEGRKPQARELVLIAVLVALNVAGRAAAECRMGSTPSAGRTCSCMAA